MTKGKVKSLTAQVKKRIVWERKEWDAFLGKINGIPVSGVTSVGGVWKTGRSEGLTTVASAKARAIREFAELLAQAGLKFEDDE